MLNLILYINASKAIVLELHVPKRTPFFSFSFFTKLNFLMAEKLLTRAE